MFISNWYCTIRFDYKTRKDTLPFLELYLLEIMLHEFRNIWKQVCKSELKSYCDISPEYYQIQNTWGFVNEHNKSIWNKCKNAWTLKTLISQAKQARTSVAFPTCTAAFQSPTECQLRWQMPSSWGFNKYESNKNNFSMARSNSSIVTNSAKHNAQYELDITVSTSALPLAKLWKERWLIQLNRWDLIMIKINNCFKLKKTPIIVFNYTLPYPYNC